MSNVSLKNKALARMALQAFGGAPEVTTYWDEKKETSVDILVCEGGALPGIKSLSTLGLSDYPLVTQGQEYRDEDGSLVRLEMVAACASDSKIFSNILATAAFCVMRSGWFCEPGAIFPDLVHRYDPKASMQHVMFVPPFLWEDRLKTTSFDAVKVAWLFALPISEAEYRYAVENSSTQLQQRLAEKNVDVTDLHRTSAV